MYLCRSFVGVSYYMRSSRLSDRARLIHARVVIRAPRVKLKSEDGNLRVRVVSLD